MKQTINATRSHIRSIRHALLPASIAVFLLLAGCGGEEAQPQQSASAQQASALHFESEAVRGRGCEFLLANDVAAATGVSVDLLQQQSSGSTCIYTWDTGEVRLRSITVAEDAAAASRNFANVYSEYSDEEVAEAVREGEAELERRTDGTLSEEDRAAAGRVSGGIGDIVAATTYERISGIGDEAVYDGTVHEINTPMIGRIYTPESAASVRLGNLTFTVEGKIEPAGGADPRARPAEATLERNREVTVDLARRVEARLRSL